jgi:succinate dehydrogenase/fumarate reductase flavoprotein subunit
MKRATAGVECETLQADVVIVGSEGAGATAAIELARRGLSAIMITKGNGMGRSGATITGEADLAVDSRSLHERFHMAACDPADSKDKFLEDIVLGGKYLVQQDLAEAHVEDAPERLQDLLDWGLKPLFVAKMSGHSYPRGVIVSAPEMIKIYRKHVQATGFRLLTNIMVQELLCREGRCLGVFGLDLKTGRFLAVKAHATLLATGGGMRIYPITTAPEELTGDGTAMALRAGAELMDMEFPMFLPGCFPWPAAVRGVNTPFKLSSAGMVHGHLLNKHGERFMARWDPVKMERSTRDILAVAIWTEIMENRGSPHGGVFVSLKHLPENLVQYILEWLPPRYLKRYGGFDMNKFLPDLTREAVESVPACHFFNGGIKIDRDGRSSLPGLYAAGEVIGGIHGSNRLSGNAFTDMIVWGHRAAAGIAADLGGGKAPAAPEAAGAGGAQVEEQVAVFTEEATRPFAGSGGRGGGSAGESTQELRDRLSQTAWSKVGIVRTRELLEEARNTIRELRAAYGRVSLRCQERVYNREWLRYLELRNMIDNVEGMVEAALAREESRGAHYRKDFPQTDHERWAQNQLITGGRQGGVKIRRQPPVITRVAPPKKVEKYGY